MASLGERALPIHRLQVAAQVVSFRPNYPARMVASCLERSRDDIRTNGFKEFVAQRLQSVDKELVETGGEFVVNKSTSKRRTTVVFAGCPLTVSYN